MSEVRTTSATGGEKGVKPQRYGLLPKPGLDAIAEVFGFGASKYADHNWRRGYEWDKSFDALLRHAFAAQNGETYDEESGLPHLAHAGFHVLVLLTWLAEQGEGPDNPFDTRWPAAMERARREQAEPPVVRDEYGVVEPYEDDEIGKQWIEDEVWQVANLGPVLDSVNRMIARAVDEQFGQDLAAAPFLRRDREVGVEWRTPEVPIAQGMLDSLRLAQGALTPARFACGEYGIEDADHPLSDEQNKAAEAGMIRISTLGGTEVWADREVLEGRAPTYSIDLPAQMLSDPTFDPTYFRHLLNNWINAHD